MLIIAILLVFSGHLSARPKQETDLFEKGKELSYEGQLEKANSLLGNLEGKEGREGQTPEPAKDGWDGTSLMLSMIWGAIGTGYFIFGKKQSRFTFLICGIGLVVFPMFVSDTMVSVFLGLAMCIAPFKIEF